MEKTIIIRIKYNIIYIFLLSLIGCSNFGSVNNLETELCYNPSDSSFNYLIKNRSCKKFFVSHFGKKIDQNNLYLLNEAYKIIKDTLAINLIKEEPAIRYFFVSENDSSLMIKHLIHLNAFSSNIEAFKIRELKELSCQELFTQIKNVKICYLIALNDHKFDTVTKYFEIKECISK